MLLVVMLCLAHKITDRLDRPFSEAVQPSSTTYPQVQQGAVNQTLDELESDLVDKNEAREAEIRRQNAPSLSGCLKAAGIAAGVTVGISLAVGLSSKYLNENKNVFKGQLTEEDWSELGLDTVKAAGAAAVTSVALYGLTNCAGIAAPVAGAFAGASRAVAGLASEYRLGNIDADALVDQSLIACSEVTVVTLFTMAGQVAIPVPVVGALLGSLAGKYAAELLGEVPQHIHKKIQAQVSAQLDAVSDAHKDALERLSSALQSSSSLTSFAFSTRENMACLSLSAELARSAGVAESNVLKTSDDVLEFLSQP